MANRSVVLPPPDTGQSLKPQNLFLDRIAARAGGVTRPKTRRAPLKSPQAGPSSRTILDSPEAVTEPPQAESFGPVAPEEMTPLRSIATGNELNSPGSWENEFDGLAAGLHPDVAAPEVPELDPSEPIADLAEKRMDAFRRRYGADDDASSMVRPTADGDVSKHATVGKPDGDPSQAAPKVSKRSTRSKRGKGGPSLFETLKGLRLRKPAIPKLTRPTYIAFLGALFVVILLQLRTPVFNFVNANVEEARRHAAFEVFGDYRAMGDGTGKPIGEFELLDETLMERTDYRLDFAAIASKGGVGWAVRAADGDNYYAFRVERVGRKLQFRRYPVIDGVPQKAEEIVAPVTGADLTDGVRVSARVTGAQISTFVNGNGVDYFREERLSSGGVGFFTEGRDEASLSYYSVRGNQDSWGLTLFGAIGLWDDAVKFFSEDADEEFSPTQLSQIAE